MDSTQAVDDGLRNFLDVFEQTLETEKKMLLKKQQNEKLKKKL